MAMILAVLRSKVRTDKEKFLMFKQKDRYFVRADIRSVEEDVLCVEASCLSSLPRGDDPSRR